MRGTATFLYRARGPNARPTLCQQRLGGPRSELGMWPLRTFTWLLRSDDAVPAGQRPADTIPPDAATTCRRENTSAAGPFVPRVGRQPVGAARAPRARAAARLHRRRTDRLCRRFVAVVERRRQHTLSRPARRHLPRPDGLALPGRVEELTNPLRFSRIPCRLAV